MVRAHPELSVTTLAQSVGMAPKTLARIVEEGRDANFTPIRVRGAISEDGLVVRGPGGLVIKGLDVKSLGELLRALS